ncbi:MAG: hypothetical protein WD830_00635 [Chloroflexota bacterium]
MGTEAVAVLPSRALPGAVRRGQEPQADAQLTSLRRQLGYGRRLRPRRSHLALVALVIVAFWVVLSFGRTITQLNAANDRQTGLMAETAALSAQLDAGHRELELVQMDGFQALQARAFGIGAPGEIAFSLEAGAPVASPVTPLGSAGRAGEAQTPLDAWLRLLFGD